MKKRLLSILLASVLAIMPMCTDIYAEETENVTVFAETEEPVETAADAAEPETDPAETEEPGEPGEAVVTAGTEDVAGEEDADYLTSQEGEDKAIKSDDVAEASVTVSDEESADASKDDAVVPLSKDSEDQNVKSDADTDEKAAEEKKYPKFEYSEEKDGYTITLSADEGVLPEDTEVKIERITKVEDTEVSDIIEDELPPETEIVELVVFDITFYSDNEEIEPKDGAVNVSIKLTQEMGSVMDEAEESEEDSSVEITVFHIDTDGEEAKAELVESEVNEENEVVFDAEEFSPYGIVLTATRKYTVRFNGNGATSGSMENMECEVNQTYDLPAVGFARRGYRFTGWNTKADGSGTGYANKAQIKNVSVVNGRIVTFYAQWRLMTYTITYNLNGGTNSASNPATYDIYTETIDLQPAKKDKMYFMGWYSDAGFTKPVTGIPKGSFGNKTFYARFRKTRYTIRYRGHGATGGTMKDQICSTDKDYNLTPIGYSKRGYRFTGWNTKADGSGTAYANKAVIRNLSVVEGRIINLYAQWTLVTYPITYELNGGTNSASNPVSYTVNSATINLQPAKKDKMYFMGWYSDAGFTKQVTQIPKGSWGTKVLYARFRRIRYNVHFDGNGATGGRMRDQICAIDKEYTLTPVAYTRRGYRFIRWTANADGSGKRYADKASIKNLSQKEGTVINMYAQWKANAYRIRFSGNGSTSGSMSNMSCTYGTTYILPSNSFERSGYRFKGWNTKPDGSGASYADNAAVSDLSETNGDTVVLYAQWNKKQTIVWLGDSLTQGSLGDEDDNLDNAPYVRLAGRVDVPVEGYGLFAYNTWEIFHAYTTKYGQKIDPDKIYIFWVGSNDWVVDGEANCNTAPVMAKIDDFLSQNGGVKNYIVLGTTSRRKIKDLYIPINRDLSEHYGIHYMDVIELINQYGYSSDRTHLSQASYNAIADAVYDKLMSMGYL